MNFYLFLTVLIFFSLPNGLLFSQNENQFMEKDPMHLMAEMTEKNGTGVQLDNGQRQDFNSYANVRINAFKKYVSSLCDPQYFQDYEELMFLATDLFVNSRQIVELDSGNITIEEYLNQVHFNQQTHLRTSIEGIYPASTFDGMPLVKTYRFTEKVLKTYLGMVEPADKFERIVDCHLIPLSQKRDSANQQNFKVKLGTISLVQH